MMTSVREPSVSRKRQRADGPSGGREADGRDVGPSSLRRRRMWRRLLPVAVLAALAVSMASAVRRGAEARRLSREIEVFRRAEDLVRERLREERGRADSLASRARIHEAAERLGLRPATDDEIVFLVDVADSVGGGGE